MLSATSFYKSPAGYAAAMADYDARLARWPIPVETQSVPTRYGATQVLVAGPPPGLPVLLLHGWTANASGNYWEYPSLFQQYRVYSPDTIGQTGKSAPTSPPTQGSAYGEWLVDVLRALNLPPVRVIGISGGGWLTLKLAAFAPAYVRQAVALSASGLVPFQLSFFLNATPALLFPHATTLRWFLNSVTSPEAPKDTAGFAEFQKMLAVSLWHYKARSRPAFIPAAELQRIQAPTFLFMGQYERTVNPHASVARAKRFIPGLVAAEVLPQVGHAMTIDFPARVGARILQCLREND